MTCPNCGLGTSAGQYCDHCRAPLALPRVVISKGDTGLDKSQTTVDASSHVTSHQDDHSTTVQRIESHVTTTDKSSKFGDVGVLYFGLSGGVVAVIVVVAILAVVFVVWLAFSQGRPAPAPGEPSAASPPSAQAQPPAPSPQMGGGASGGSPEATSPPPATKNEPSARSESPRREPPSYVNRSAFDADGVAVMIVGPDGTIESDLAQQVASAVGGTDGLFTEAFVRGGLFERAYRGDGAALSELGLAQAARAIVLATRRVTTTPQTVAGQDMFKAEIQVSARMFRPSEGWQGEGFTIFETAAGFSPADAIRYVEASAAKKLVARIGLGR